MIDHKVIAKHFGKSNEGMRKLRRGGSPLYQVYIKAYLWDTRHTDPLGDSISKSRFDAIPVTIATNNSSKYVAYNPKTCIVKYTDGVDHWSEKFYSLEDAIKAYERLGGKNENNN